MYDAPSEPSDNDNVIPTTTSSYIQLVCYPRSGKTAIQVFHNTGAHTHRITGPRYNLHPSTEAHLGSSPASIAKAIYPVAHLSAQANANPRFIWNRKPKDLQAAGSKA